ncbi:hypothetical protein SAY86_002116 [Trapa natans]|uniref:Cysteine-rich receptor-like protein kinase 2 n=1 Tax=Trapa natans TaxID=22666 RepID=A0AAN7LF28_TRANT|nr:hypothetical protein SAY86_002116 [Trapa natans]
MKVTDSPSAFLHLIGLFIITATFLLGSTDGDPRTSTVRMICGDQLEHNGTIFVPNFIAVMENISAQMRTKGYGYSIIGTGPDTNFGHAQCYGDLSLLDCVLCYTEARSLLPQCYPHNGGRIFLDGCFMRVENYSFFEEFTGPNDTAVCGNQMRKGSLFEEHARHAVARAAAIAPRNGGYARVEAAAAGSGAYVLANCWKTLNSSSCSACLVNASSLIMKCLPWSEGRALNTGCFMRYSDTDFLNKVPARRSNRGTIIVIVVSIVSALVVLAVGITITLLVWKQRYIQKKRKGKSNAKKLVKILRDSSLNFKYSVLEKATASFDSANKLGQGGFGTVYKGVLPDGREIAVKRLFFNNKHRAEDFYNEVNIISSVEHKNLVRLLGCSCCGPESLLVYEFLPNKSLDRFIFDANRGKALNWEKRLEIMVGTAEGLACLHENSKVKIIHRDIKASNILLDSRLRAKIADFGLARSFQEDKSHISTVIAGTLGYMAPEYLAHGQLTERADVYSFGVLLLETVTGRQNNRSKTDEYSESIITIAWNHFQAGTVEELYDPNLMLDNYHNSSSIKNEVLRVIHIGLLCTQEAPSLRPAMSRIHAMLTKMDEELPVPTNPPFMDEKTMEFHGTYADGSYLPHTKNYESFATISASSFNPR